jgi:hypothetical protein
VQQLRASLLDDLSAAGAPQAETGDGTGFMIRLDEDDPDFDDEDDDEDGDEDSDDDDEDDDEEQETWQVSWSDLH